MRPKALFVILCFALVASTLAAGSIYYFVQNDLESNLELIREKTAELDTIDEKARLLNDTKIELQTLKDQNIDQKISTILPDVKNQPQAIQNLYSIFDQNKIELTGITFESTEDEPNNTSQSTATDVTGVLSLPVELTFNPEMSYSKAKNLIKDLQQSSRHLSISEMQLTPNLDSGNVLVSISVDIHFEAEVAGATSELSREEVLKQIEEGNQQ
ncbi:TPA: hypothetical protein EYO12_03105 [Candidatus Saccharibacteria bacterium]|nr:hypothetical protein [Candidatus Saccharibacteria bacterium]HIO87978.1 hypothetical protein [Candidatus Saccharibacteria bacterium]